MHLELIFYSLPVFDNDIKTKKAGHHRLFIRLFNYLLKTTSIKGRNDT